MSKIDDTKIYMDNPKKKKELRKRKMDEEICKENVLSDKEKIIILSMIACRTFSNKSPIDLLDDIIRDQWKYIIDKSYEKLKELNLISIDINKLYDEYGIEHPVANLFRINAINLQRKTKGLFRSTDNGYFLNIYRESDISKNDLSYILSLLVTKDGLRGLDDIYEFCLNISNDKHLLIFDPSEHIFSKPKYDNIMKDIILYNNIHDISIVDEKNIQEISDLKPEKDLIKNKEMIERAEWYAKKIIHSDIDHKIIILNYREYPSEFVENLPKLGSIFRLIDVRTWKKYDAYMNPEKYQISRLNELYKDKEYKIRTGLIIGIANSPENINDIWIDFEYGDEKKDKEKIIILSMIAIRAFSDKSSLNLQNETVRDELKEVINRSYDQLKKLNLVTLDKDNLYDKSGIEHPIVNLFRLNSRSLKKKTKGLFRNNDGDVIYFLDASQKSEILKDHIVNLLEIIVDKKNLNLDEIYRFCLNISNDKHLLIFDPSEHIFSKPKYDNIMKDIILYYFNPNEVIGNRYEIFIDNTKMISFDKPLTFSDVKYKLLKVGTWSQYMPKPKMTGIDGAIHLIIIDIKDGQEFEPIMYYTPDLQIRNELQYFFAKYIKDIPDLIDNDLKNLSKDQFEKFINGDIIKFFIDPNDNTKIFVEYIKADNL